MPKTKHHKKKYPNSEWVRRRNLRRQAAKQVSRPSSSEPVMAMVDSSDNTKEIRSTAQKAKPKGWLAAMKNVFAGRGER
jgi:hypothetical protein|tara:strand:- start:574 stop:810 length:237 start_codon:yes stop_codon:yes gene_type:complete